MSKIEIKEVQIDSFKQTYNSNNTFKGGLNIICGENEVGKTTLMEFIKNVFIKKSDAKGYIKCSLDGEEFNLRAEKTKQKENEPLLNINSHEYQTGFVINLDDIVLAKKTELKELLDTIQDSSGNAVNDKEKEYFDYIYTSKKQKFELTPTDLPSGNFKKQFDKLKELDVRIEKLKSKEEEYNNLCLSISDIEEEIKNLTLKKQCSDIMAKLDFLKKSLEEIKINKVLIENKKEFESIRESYGAINFVKQKEEDIKKDLKEKEQKFEDVLREINNITPISAEDIIKLEINSDDLKLNREIVDAQREYSLNIQALEKEIESINNRIEELKFEIKTLENNLEETGIKDFDKYKNDRILLESYKTNYADLMSKVMNKNNIRIKKWYKDYSLLIFLLMFIMSVGSLFLYWNTNLRYMLSAFVLVGFVGINTIIMEKIERKRNESNYSYDGLLENSVSDILRLCKEYGFLLSKDDNFVIKLDSFIQIMREKISEYNIIESNLLKQRVNLEKEKKYLETKKENLKSLEQLREETFSKIKEFLGKTGLENISDFSDFYEGVNALKVLKKEIDERRVDLEKLDKDTEEFIKKINTFVEKTGLENIPELNKYDYPKFNDILADIRNIIDENISNNKVVNEYNTKINEAEEELKNYPEALIREIYDYNDITLIENELQVKKEEKIRLLKTKDDLERESDLINLKNEKMGELENIKNSILKLLQKKMVYKIIKKSKEKFNQTRPNLVNAKKYFSKITNGKYNNIDFDRRVIKGDNIGEKGWDILSRGTKEQLYLALRLGYANNYSKNPDNKSNGKPNLPLIIDDAFVNFDCERTAAVFKSLAEFAEENQVLYFTCHTKRTLEILKTEKIEYNLIEL